jgi:hypothetical protein
LAIHVEIGTSPAPQAQWLLAPRFTGVPKKRPLFLGVEAWGWQNKQFIRSPVGTAPTLQRFFEEGQKNTIRVRLPKKSNFYFHTGKAGGFPN